MDAPTIAASASLAVALVAFAGLAAPVYLRLGKLEGEVKAGRERSDEQYREARERSDAQHAETLAEIRRLTDAAQRFYCTRVAVVRNHHPGAPGGRPIATRPPCSKLDRRPPACIIAAFTSRK